MVERVFQRANLALLRPLRVLWIFLGATLLTGFDRVVVLVAALGCVF
jgi:hypothetical protein